MMIRKGAAVVVGAGLVLLAGGCPLLEVKIEAAVEEVCVTYPDLVIPGSDGSGAISHSFVYDDLTSISIEGLDSDVEFTRVVLRVKDGGAQLDFVDAAHVTVSAPGLPELTLVDCAGDCPSGGSELSLDAGGAADALAYLEGESIAMTLDVAGTLPAQQWTVDVDVCAKGTVRYTVEP